MNEHLDKLEPRAVFEQFKPILSIPRPSKKEEKMTAYLKQWGESRGLETIVEEIGNVIIRKPATKGMENRKMVCLQSHIDMVCEKNSDKVFNFETDAIETYVEDGWLKAKGTTLGADDGIGVATALAILDSKDIAHPDIECLFTVDEETGLTGAFHLRESSLKSNILINLDSEDEGEMFIGCAGGVDTLGYMPVTMEPACQHAVPYLLTIKGLKGGHSGDDINKGLACANKLLTRIFWKVNTVCKIKLCDIDGGNLRNAIAREAKVVFMVNPNHEEQMLNIVNTMIEQMKFEFRTTEPNLQITIEKTDRPETMMTRDDATKLLNCLYAIPHGVLAMSREIPNFVETSTNLASVKIKDGEVHIVTSQRSSVESALDAAKSRVEACMLMAGCRVEHTDGYPGWTPNTDSEILNVVVASYERLFNKKPIVRAIHAGLECGLIGKKYPKMDMISYGPTLRGVHSPDEKMDIKTLQMFWEHTIDILKNIPEK
ncbi:MAG: aminoacyl-histidine dipeptidase [Bacteroidales bacterium]|nr:aminoacyl-histidine dipeptidase [Bacteroidales bacterium]